MDERKAIREVIDLEAEASQGGCTIRVEVYEISTIGCMIASRDGALLVAGEAITLDLGAPGPIEGELIWAEGNVGGVQFNTVLEEATVQGLRPPRPASFDNTFRDRFGRPLASLQRRFSARPA